MELNEKDNELLAFCRDRPLSINQIASMLKIKPSSVSIRVSKLEEAGLVLVERKGHGKKTFVRTASGQKTGDFIIECLKKAKERGGNISWTEFQNLPDFNPDALHDPDAYDKRQALFYLEYYSKFFDKRMVLNSEGEKFIKQNKKAIQDLQRKQDLKTKIKNMKKKK